MSVSDAAGEYHAQHKGNCAQSVCAGYTQVTGKNPEWIDEMSKCGGGRAPEGYCGALWAAMQSAGKENEEKVIEEFKKGSQGCTKCKEIRGGNVIPCNQCVRNAGKAIEDLGL